MLWINVIKTSADTELLLISVSGIHLLIRDHFIIMPQKISETMNLGLFQWWTAWWSQDYFFLLHVDTAFPSMSYFKLQPFDKIWFRNDDGWASVDGSPLLHGAALVWNLFRSNWTVYVLVWSLKFQNQAVLNMANARTCDCAVNAHLMWNYSQMFHGFKKQWISLSGLYEIDFIANKKNLFTNVTHICPDKCSRSQNRSISSDTVFSLTTGGNKRYGCTLQSLRKTEKT